MDNLLIAAVAWKQTAAEYRALYHQGYNVARMQVELALAKRKLATARLAVVSDGTTPSLAAGLLGPPDQPQHGFLRRPDLGRVDSKNQMMLAPGRASSSISAPQVA